MIRYYLFRPLNWRCSCTLNVLIFNPELVIVPVSDGCHLSLALGWCLVVFIRWTFLAVTLNKVIKAALSDDRRHSFVFPRFIPTLSSCKERMNWLSRWWWQFLVLCRNEDTLCGWFRIIAANYIEQVHLWVALVWWVLNTLLTLFESYEVFLVL